MDVFVRYPRLTSFEFAVHPIGPTVMFLAPLYRAEDGAAVMRGWRDFMATAPDEISGSMIEFSTIPEDPEYPEETWGSKIMVLAGVWAGPADEGQQALQPLRELAEPLLDFSGQMLYCEVQSIYDAMFPKGVHRAYFKSVYLNGFDDAMSDTIHPTLYKPIELQIDIKEVTARVFIPGMVESTGGPIRPDHTEDSVHRVKIVIPGGIEFEVAEMGSASTITGNESAVELNLTGSYGQWNLLKHSGSGIVRAC